MLICWASFFSEVVRCRSMRRLTRSQLCIQMAESICSDAYADPREATSTPWAEDQSPCNLGRGANPHASFHASGRLHSKSYNIRAVEKSRQVPDANFKGTEPLVATNADRGLSPTLPVLSGNFDGVFEIDSTQIAASRNPSITVDVSEPGIPPIRQTGRDRVIAEQIFKDDTPWIVVSLVEPPTRL